MQKYFKIILISIIFLFFTIILFIFSYFNNKKIVSNKKNNEIKILKKKNIKNEETKDEKNIFYVDIKGAVNNPGMYGLEENSRVNDAINIAGGLKEKADVSIINLSKKIEDEMVIIIYTSDEIEQYKKELKQISEINQIKKEEIICPDLSNKACINNISQSKINNTNNGKKEDNNKTSDNNKLVSINTASKEELMTVNGIGEGKAESIIKYREQNGNFSNIEDIKNVSGIGDSLFEKIKDYITI